MAKKFQERRTSLPKEISLAKYGAAQHLNY
jgi:hypothetical protein